jgi:hypothetical protein
MKIRNFLKFLAIILIPILHLSPGILYAQVDSLYKGDTIRVTAPKYLAQSLTGTFSELKKDSLAFNIYEKVLFAIPLQQITKLEVARGEEGNALKGAIIGALSGGLGLGLIAAIDASGKQKGWFTATPGQAFVSGLIPGLLLGSVTGAIIGSGSKSVRWVEVSIEAISVGERTQVMTAELREKETKVIEQERAVTPKRRWRFSVTVGTTNSGPASDIEKAMVRDGFDKTVPPSFLGGPVKNPFSKTGFGEIGALWSMQLSYLLNQSFECAVLFSRAAIGTTSGYTDPAIFLDLDYYATTISPMIIYKAPSILQLGFGPGVFINKIGQDEKTRLGGVFQATLLFPQQTLFFVKLDAQYRLVPKATYGPFKAGMGNAVRYLQSFEADFSHLFVSFGFGIHL